MTVSIEVLAEAHRRSPALRLLLEGIPPPFLLVLRQAAAWLARSCAMGETVAFLGFTPNARR